MGGGGWINAHTHTHGQQRDLLSLFYFSNKESRLNIGGYLIFELMCYFKDNTEYLF
jgi:hypothetical protein